MADLPTGTVTFLFTDIAGSTRLWERHPDAMRGALARHDALVRSAIEAHGGHVFKTVGDAFCAAFQTAPAAVAAALAAQRALAAEAWPAEAPIAVRVGIHTGAAEARDGDYVGTALNRVARLMGAGHGGQVLVSAAAWELVRDDLPAGVGLRDLGEQRLKDLRRPERVFQLSGPGLAAEFPPLATLDARPHNLPVQVTSFVGREREMADLKRLLATARLVTLTGIGGTGKTRLALQAAADLVDDFADGAWFVDLAPMSDPALVAGTVASALGVKEEADRPVEATLADALAGKALLVVLDNCEHVVEASAALADRILRAARGVRILATSREALAIAGEAACPIPPLPLPPLSADGRADVADLAALAQYEAVRLFIDRAEAALPSFQVTNANAPAVAGICHRLDGIPLAIELAAARVRALGPEQIAARLDDRFRLLTGGSRVALPRQQTLRAAIDWSHDLLDGAERALFRRLAVFHGGWTLEAAEGVCADDAGADDLDGPRSAGAEPGPAGDARTPDAVGISDPPAAGVDAFDVMDLLTHLVEKSLVAVDTAAAPPRYRFLETVRAYAREKLTEAGEADALRSRHLTWYARLTDAFDPGYGNPDYLAWLDRLELERPNLRAALRWGLDEPARVARAAVLIRPLWALWQDHGHHREGHDWFALAHARALDVGLDTAQPGVVGWVCYGLAVFEGALAPARFEARAVEACALFQHAGDRRGWAWSVLQLAFATSMRGDFDAAAAHVASGLEMLRDLGVPPGELAAVLVFAGEVQRMKGDHAAAAGHFRDCLAINPDDRWAHHNLGHVLLRVGDLEASETALCQSLGLVARWRNPIHLASTLGGFGGIAAARGRALRAARLFGAAEAILSRCGGTFEAADRGDWQHHRAAARALLDGPAWDAAAAQGAALSEEQAVAYAAGEEDRWGDDPASA